MEPPQDRLMMIVGLAALVTVVVAVARLWSSRRLRALRTSSPEPLWQALGTRPDGRPTVVAFSTPSCAACRSAQAPVLQMLEREAGRIRILSIDAEAQPDVARAFRIATVPSTVVLSASGKVVAANNGLALMPTLLAQVRSAAA